MSLKLSYNAKLYRLDDTRASWGDFGADGRYHGDAPEGLELIADVADLVLPAEFTEANVTTRLSGGYEAIASTICKVSIDVPMVYDPDDTGMMALLKAALTKTTIPIAVMDGDVAGASRGFWADMAVTVSNKSEKLEEAQMLTFTLKPGLSSVAPQWVRVPNWPTTITLTSPQDEQTINGSDHIELTWTSDTGYLRGEIILDAGTMDETSLNFWDPTMPFDIGTPADIGATEDTHTLTIRINGVDSNSIEFTYES